MLGVPAIMTGKGEIDAATGWPAELLAETLSRQMEREVRDAARELLAGDHRPRGKLPPLWGIQE